MSFDGVNITNEGVRTNTYERKSRNGYYKIENSKRKTSDDNKSTEENASKKNKT